MTSSRCCAVLGCPRSGSSALAGALDFLGVQMRRQYDQPIDFLNERGYVEDSRWQILHKAVSGNRYVIRQEGATPNQLDAYRRLIRLCSSNPIWGMKSPRLAFTFQFVKPLLQEAGVDTRVVVARRDFESIVQSFKRHTELAYGGRWPMTEEQAREHMTKWNDALEWQLVQWDGPTYEVDYDRLLAEPVTELCALHDYCYEDLDVPGHKRVITPALNWLDRGLRHFNGNHHPDAESGNGNGDGKTGFATGWVRKRPCRCRGG